LYRSSILNSRFSIRVGLPVAPLVMVAFMGVTGMAQDTRPAATQPAGSALDPAHIDGSFGFSVQPPAGCTLYREKQIAEGDVEVARFVNLAFQWSFTVRHSTSTRPLDAQTQIAELTSRLGTQHQELQVLKGEPAKIAGRNGVHYEASFKAEGVAWLRQQAIVPYLQNEYLSLVLLTPLAHREAAEPLFDRIVASFQLLRDERARARIQTALEQGEKLLRLAAAGEIDIGARLVEDSYIRCLMEGREIGYVRVSERSTTIDHRKGVQIREWGWLFNPDGSTTHLEHDMFLATDLSFERWENRLYVLPPAQGTAPRQLLIDIENAIREGNQLGVAYLPRPNSLEKRDKLISVEKSYASAALNVLLPRLLDLSRPAVYAFSSYKSERRGLILRTLEVLGPARIQVDGQDVSAFKIEDSEGLIAPKTEIYADRSGKLLRVVVDRLEMMPATAHDIELRYGKKVAEAQDLFKKLQPQPPSPPPSTPGAESGTPPGRRPQSPAPRTPRSTGRR